MEKIEMKKEQVKDLFDSRFLRVFDLQYEEGKHYFDATRRTKENLVALKSDGEFQKMLPDAVTCIIILQLPEEEPRLLFSYEYRYPTGQFLLSPTAGLIDPEDREREDALLLTAKREILEETGIQITEKDRLEVLSPCCFSSPGMTDESNALVAALIQRDDLKELNQDGAVGTEKFNGFRLYTKKEALNILKQGRDEYGNFFSVYTWCALTYFVSDLWK